MDGSEEAEQVNKFLDSEHKAFQRPGVFSPEEVEVESDVELHPTTADSGGEPEASNKDSEFQIEDGVEVKGGHPWPSSLVLANSCPVQNLIDSS